MTLREILKEIAREMNCSPQDLIDDNYKGVLDFSVCPYSAGEKRDEVVAVNVTPDRCINLEYE